MFFKYFFPTDQIAIYNLAIPSNAIALYNATEMQNWPGLT